ncbi:MAG TPA: hypothetical protein VGF45_19845 [Polyangia bacterium]
MSGRDQATSVHAPYQSRRELPDSAQLSQLSSAFAGLMLVPMRISAAEALPRFQAHLVGEESLGVADPSPFAPFVRALDDVLAGGPLASADVIAEIEAELLPRELHSHALTPALLEGGIHSVRRQLASVDGWCVDHLNAAPLTTRMRGRVDELLAQVRASSAPFVFVNSVHRNQYDSFFAHLVARGHDVFVIERGSQSTRFADYTRPAAGACRHKYLLNALEQIDFLRRLDKGVAMFVTEAFIHHLYSGFRAAAQDAYVHALMRLCHVPTIACLYDVVNPFDVDLHLEDEYLRLHSNLLREAGGVVLNANTDMTATFLTRAFGLSNPVVSFLRYNEAEAPTDAARPARRPGEFHIALVGAFLDDLVPGQRDRMRELSPQIRRLLERGVDVHSYGDLGTAALFRRQLPPNLRRRFHVYGAIADQAALIAEVAQHDAGWMVHKTQVPISVAARAHQPVFKDAVYLFHLSTVPSSILLFGSAGLPMFISRSEQGLLRTFGSEGFIPIELSEVDAIDAIIAAQDWPRLRQAAREKRGRFGMAAHFDEFARFLAAVEGHAKAAPATKPLRPKQASPQPAPASADSAPARTDETTAPTRLNPWTSGQATAAVAPTVARWLSALFETHAISVSPAAAAREAEATAADGQTEGDPYRRLTAAIADVLAPTGVALEDVLTRFEAPLLLRELHTYPVVSALAEASDARLRELTQHPETLVPLVLQGTSATARMRSKVDAVLTAIRAETKPILFVNNVHRFQYGPLLSALEKAGHTVFSICRGYQEGEPTNLLATATGPEQRRVYLNAFELADLAARADHGVWITNSEGFIHSHFEGGRALANEAYLAGLMRVMRQPVLLLLYDMVNQFSHELEYEAAYDHVHAVMLKSASRVVLNSNTRMACDFVARAYHLAHPVTSFLRYNELAERFVPPQGRARGEFHVCMAGAFLGDEWQRDRMRHMSPAVRDLLNAGLFVHYYGDPANAAAFAARLPAEQRPRFIRHEVIRDQAALVREISGYDAGWMVHQTQEAAAIMHAMQRPRMKDAIYVFHLSTVPSSILLFGCAGLPIFINRSMQGIVEDLADDSVVPVELSELPSIGTWLPTLDWEGLRARAQKNAARFSMQAHANDFIDLVQPLFAAASTTSQR